MVGLVLSGKVWLCLMVRTTPEKVSGNLQVSNIMTTPGVMAELFPYTCLPLAWGFACSLKHPIVLQNILSLRLPMLLMGKAAYFPFTLPAS